MQPHIENPAVAGGALNRDLRDASQPIEKVPELLQGICNITIANAKLAEFVNQADLAGYYVRVGLLDRASAADMLHEAAIYNSLIYEYGQDRIQQIMVEGLGGVQ